MKNHLHGFLDTLNFKYAAIMKSKEKSTEYEIEISRKNWNLPFNKIYLIVFFISFVARILPLLINPNFKMYPDGYEYDTIALNIASGMGFSFNPGVPTIIRSPFYPAFLGGIYYIFGHSLFIVRMIQILLGSLVCCMAYYIANREFGRKVAILSAAIIALNPVIIAYDLTILSESLFTFFLMASLVFLINTLNKREIRFPVLAGIFMALATLTRPSLMLFPFFVFLLILSKQRFVFKWLVFAITFCFTVFPWTMRNYIVFGKFIPIATGAGFGMWSTAYQVKHKCAWSEAILASHRRIKGKIKEPEYLSDSGKHPRVKLDAELLKEAKEIIKHNRIDYLLLMMRRIIPFWFTSHSGMFGINKSLKEYLNEKKYLNVLAKLLLLGMQTLFIFGALISIYYFRKEWKKIFIFFLLIVYFSGHIAIDPCPRYHIPVLPVLIILFSASLAKLMESIRQQ